MEYFMDLQKAREKIRKVDEEMAELFVQRMEAVREVAAYKRATGLPIEDKEQEARVLKARTGQIRDEALRPFYIQFLKNNIEISKKWQQYLMDENQCEKAMNEKL